METQENTQQEETPVVVEATKPEKRTPRPRQPDTSESAEQISRADDRSVLEWLTNELAGQSRIRIKVTRVQPKMYNGQKADGLLDEFDEFITEQDIRDRYGGGKFAVQAMKMTAQGRWQYAGQRTVDIAGPPKIVDDGSGVQVVTQSEDTSITKHILTMSERMAADERRRADRAEQELRANASKSGLDDGMIDRLLQTFRDQTQAQQADLKELRQTLASREEKLMDLASKRPEVDPVQTQLLSRLIDDDQGRLNQIRTAHETELRTLREQLRDEVKRAEDRVERLMEEQKAVHAREIDSLNRSHDHAVKMQDVAYSTQVKTLEGQLNNVVSELAAARTELAELRGKKDQPLEDQLTRVMALKELFQSLGGKEDEPEVPQWKQIVEAVSENPVVQGIAQRVAGGAAQPAMPQPPPRPRLPHPIQRRPGTVQVARPQVTQRPSLPPQAPPQPGQPPAPQQVQAAPQMMTLNFDPVELAAAVKYIETAVANEVDPANFAPSVRSMVPTTIISAIRAGGIDALLQAAGVSMESPLYTQTGLTFLRKLAKILSEQS